MTTQERRQEVARLLRQRRMQLQPADAGLMNGNKNRRVPGLRREEVAILANISVDWYTRLEQGRLGAQPSIEVLDRLAAALQMSEAEYAHLLALVWGISDNGAQQADPTLCEAVQHILDSLNPSPAYLLDRYWNTIAWNLAARRVLADFPTLPEPARNLGRILFLTPPVRQFIRDWESNARRFLAQFRADYGQNLDDPEFKSLVEELRRESAEIRDWWDHIPIGSSARVSKRLNHPQLGELEVEQTSYIVEDSPGWRVVIYHPRTEVTRQKLVRLCQEE